MMEMAITFIRSLRSAPVLLAAALATLPGCGDPPPADLSLPSKENLYEYSIAVARRARSLVPSDRAQALFNTGFVHKRFGMEEKAEKLFRPVCPILPWVVCLCAAVPSSLGVTPSLPLKITQSPWLSTRSKAI